jgi:hypothetical protein
VFSVTLLSAGGGIANAEEAAGCDVTAGPPDSSSLGSSCNGTNLISAPNTFPKFTAQTLPLTCQELFHNAQNNNDHCLMPHLYPCKVNNDNDL